MDVFEADLVAYREWWLFGGDKPRRQSTCDEYIRHIRHWWEWTTNNLPAQPTTPTLRGVNHYIRVLRQRNEHAVVGFVRAIKSWSKWLVDDGVVTEDPLATLKFVKSPTPQRTPVAELEDIAAQLATCSGDSFEDVRDRAMILVLRDTGMRRGELSLMTWDRIDFNEATIFLPNDSVKNARGRTVGIEPDTVRAIHKYRRRLFEWELTNKRYPSDRVWIGRLGEMTSNGIGQMFERRSKAAEVDAPAHSYRRGYAIRYLRNGGSETYLNRTAGWNTNEMIKRYTAAKAETEALAAQRAFNATQTIAREAAQRSGARRLSARSREAE